MTALFRFVSGDFAGANFSPDLVLTNHLLKGTHKVLSQPSKSVPMVTTNHHTSHTVTRKHHQKTKKQTRIRKSKTTAKNNKERKKEKTKERSCKI